MGSVLWPLHLCRDDWNLCSNAIDGQKYLVSLGPRCTHVWQIDNHIFRGMSIIATIRINDNWYTFSDTLIQVLYHNIWFASCLDSALTGFRSKLRKVFSFTLKDRLPTGSTKKGRIKNKTDMSSAQIIQSGAVIRSKDDSKATSYSISSIHPVPK